MSEQQVRNSFISLASDLYWLYTSDFEGWIFYVRSGSCTCQQVIDYVKAKYGVV